jgi:hypothetical protein
VVLTSSVLAVLGGLIVLFLLQEGPCAAPRASFNPRYILRILTERSLRLANLGYLGHMWELYAMWTWGPLFLVDALESRSGSTALAGTIAFGVIAVGGIGSVFAGVVADRIGRTTVTSVAMDIPGPSTVFVSQNWSFTRPVYIGDTIRAEATVRSTRGDRPMAAIEFVITNQDGDEVLRGDATVYQATPTAP